MPNYRTPNKWLDRSHPQTLYLATVLLYFNAVWWVLSMLEGDYWAGLLAVAAVFAGLGLANEKKAGYWGAIVVATLNLLSLLLLLQYGAISSISYIISLMFAIALMALLVHPMTRSYRRIWFKSLTRR